MNDEGPYDGMRTVALISDELHRIQRLILGRMAPGPNEELSADAAALLDELRRVQIGLFQHPVAGQQVWSALVAEGRQFAKTDEGARWQAALSDASEMRPLRQVVEATTLHLFEEDENLVLPSAWVDLLFRALKVTDFDAFLAELRRASK